MAQSKYVPGHTNPVSQGSMQAEPQFDQTSLGTFQIDVKFKTDALAKLFAKDIDEDQEDGSL